MYVCMVNSFSDGGVHSLSVASAVARARQLCEVACMYVCMYVCTVVCICIFKYLDHLMYVCIEILDDVYSRMALK